MHRVQDEAVPAVWRAAAAGAQTAGEVSGGGGDRDEAAGSALDISLLCARCRQRRPCYIRYILL